MQSPNRPSYPQGELLPGQRVYAIGDVHGRADLLKKLIEQIKADSTSFNGTVTFIGIGDYINRGVDSAGVVDMFLNLPAHWQAVFIKGNHEWGLEKILSGQHPDWLDEALLKSYDVPILDTQQKPRNPAALTAELSYAIQSRGHEPFYRSLKLWHRIDGYGFVHSGVKPNIPLENQHEDNLMLTRPPEFRNHGLAERLVFGHTIMPEPFVEADRIGIDTGSFRTGVLTAVVLEENSVRFLQT